MKQHHNKKPEPQLSKRWRVILRVFGIILVVSALGFYIKGFYDFGNGDVDIGYNYRGLRMISNQAGRLALVLAIGGIVCLLWSIPFNKDNKDKDSY